VDSSCTVSSCEKALAKFDEQDIQVGSLERSRSWLLVNDLAVMSIFKK
jgi:hypothetical protein